MRKLLVFAMYLLAFASVVTAQGRFQTRWHCDQKSAAQKSFDVGDVAGHSLGVAQGSCTATFSGDAETTGVYTELQEMWKASFKTNGRFIVTTDNGDKLYHTYEATGDPAKKTVSEKWRIVGGTGKRKGATGSGTCTGKLHDDGSSDWDCAGTVSAAK